MAQKVVRPVINMRALLFPGGMHWLAIGLERDIIVQGKTVDDTIDNFIGMLAAWIHGALTENQRVFTNSINHKTGETKRLPGSPHEFHISYGRAELYRVYKTTITIGVDGKDTTYDVTVRFAIVRHKEDHPDNFKDQP